ncbi:ATP-dependent DNA ligase [Streptomyces sp. NPDC085900]|uniref:ATP-dependent DNA ligase n=1 Tax=Streptomyces sp. NPDC085900 TaxID=3365737 RepID=UPI0037D14C6F
MTWTLPDPVLTSAVPGPDLPARSAAEPKWDGYRAQLARRGDHVLLRSRHGTDMTSAFPEIRAAAIAQLPEQTGLDGELVVWEAGRLAFELLQQRLARRGAGATHAATQWPAHYVVFDLLHLGDTDLASWSYARRRAALEGLFADAGMGAPFTLCPSTTDPATAHKWLTWASVGVEGLCFKRLDEPYRAGARSWTKYKVRETADAIVGAVTGPVTAPSTLLLGRHDRAGRLRYTGRTTALTRAASADLGHLLTPAVGPHPWTGRTFSAGWHTREPLDVALVRPQLVVEVAVDVARDAAGRWRHPVRLHRLRPDVAAADVAPFGSHG